MIEYEQLRLNFSDYSSSEQEKDLIKYSKSKPRLFLLRVDGIWTHLSFSKESPNIDYKFYDNDNLIEVCKKLKESHPNYNIKCVINKEIEDYLRNLRKKELQINKLQKIINFNANERE